MHKNNSHHCSLAYCACHPLFFSSVAGTVRGSLAKEGRGPAIQLQNKADSKYFIPGITKWYVLREEVRRSREKHFRVSKGH